MDAEHQYLAGFDEWVTKNFPGHGPFSLEEVKEVWSAASLRMEIHKDRTIGAKLSRMEVKTAIAITTYETAAKTRMQIHRDDYERAGLLIAGLKRIEALRGRAGKIATETLDEALVSLRTLRHRLKKNV